MSTWNGAYEGVPDGADSPSTLDNVIRDLKDSTQKRMANEHDTYVADSTAGAEVKDWVHKEGSAMGYYESAAPTTQPNGEALATRDAGRLWVNSDAPHTLYIWTGSAFEESKPFQGIAIFNDTKNATAAGTFTGDIWTKRTLNTEVFNDITGASIASDVITLPSGTYEIMASAPAFDVDQHILRLRNTTDSTTTLNGSSEVTNVGAIIQTTALLIGAFTIASEKTFELQHICQTTKATYGLGNSTNITGADTVVYAQIKIKKLY